MSSDAGSLQVSLLNEVYQRSLCVAIASTVKEVVVDPGSQFLISFQLVASDKERKRPVGQNVKWTFHRQQAAAQLAQAAGYQLNRGAAQPLLEIECEPGQASMGGPCTSSSHSSCGDRRSPKIATFSW